MMKKGSTRSGYERFEHCQGTVGWKRDPLADCSGTVWYGYDWDSDCRQRWVLFVTLAEWWFVD